jgi:ABC-2 type transport system permease protein
VSATAPPVERHAPAATTPAQPAGWPRTLRAVVARGLRDNRRAPLTWGGGFGAMGAVMAAMWPSLEDSMAELMRNYPEGLREAFGIQTLDSVEKYVDVEMLSFIVPLALGLFAVRCATRSIVDAESDGHLDTLLALPLSRRVLVAGAFIVTGIVLAAILGVIWLATWLVGTIAGTGISASEIAAGMANVWPLAMAFAGLSLLAAGVLHRPATVTAVGAGALVGMYVVDLLGKLAEPMEPYRFLSAFRYYGSAIQDGIDLSHWAGLTLIAVVLAAAGAVLYERRDVL